MLRFCHAPSTLSPVFDASRRRGSAGRLKMDRPPVCDFGWKARDFDLPATDGRRYRLADVAGPRGTLLMFICNHCPYVKAIRSRIVRDATELQGLGIGVAAISANDASDYPEDSFENMKQVARENAFPFPYLYDESQDVARAYGAVCTPDFFGFNAGLELQYRGQLDASRTTPVPDARRELFEAMKAVAQVGRGPAEQIASMGCSIKWKR
jgi:peroxiredoxin